MPDTSLAAANAAAAGPIKDSILALICQGIDLVGEDVLAKMIADAIDIPYVPESLEASAIKFVISHIHAAIHKPA